MNQKFINLFVLLWLTLGSVFAQIHIKEVSKAEKIWAVKHFWAVKKVKHVTIATKKAIDSLKHTKDFDAFENGNHLDALKHALWLWSLAEEIGMQSAKSLGVAHEKGNYEFFLKHRLEDGVLPDEESCMMDLFNNEVGLALFKKHPEKLTPQKEKIRILQHELVLGTLSILLQNEHHQFLNCDEVPIKVIPNSWKQNKCLVRSNYQLKNIVK